MNKKLIVATAVILPLSGCGLPPAISIASLLMDVGSYAATGKSATDHVLSAMAGEDCAMLKVLEGDICEEERQFEDAVATLQPLGEGEGATQIAQTEPEAYKTVYVDPVEAGEPIGSRVGQVTAFRRIEIETAPTGEADSDLLIAEEEREAPGNLQLAENTVASDAPGIQEDSYLTDSHLPSRQAQAVEEPISIFAPESVKAAAAKPEPAEAQQAALPQAEEALPDPAPQDERVSTISAQVYATQNFGENNGLLGLAQQRAVTGQTPEPTDDRSVARAWGEVGSLGNNLRGGR